MPEAASRMTDDDLRDVITSAAEYAETGDDAYYGVSTVAELATELLELRGRVAGIEKGAEQPPRVDTAAIVIEPDDPVAAQLWRDLQAAYEREADAVLRAERTEAPKALEMAAGLYRNRLGAELRLIEAAYSSNEVRQLYDVQAPGLWVAEFLGMFGPERWLVTAEGLAQCGYSRITEEPTPPTVSVSDSMDEDICPGCHEPVASDRTVDDDTGIVWHASCWGKEDDRDGQ